jgi:hypothetical protein
LIAAAASNVKGVTTGDYAIIRPDDTEDSGPGTAKNPEVVFSDPDSLNDKEMEVIFGDPDSLTDEEIEGLYLEEDNEPGTAQNPVVVYGDIGDEDSLPRKGGNLRALASNLVLLCRNSNCQGGSVYAYPGAYSSMPRQIGNDALTRVYIPAGVTFTYYEHGSYGGWRRTFGEPRRSINLYMGGHNDAVSSFIIRQF